LNIPLKEVYFDEDIYPRLKKSPTTEEVYKESLEAGANFPPIEVQYVNIDVDSAKLERERRKLLSSLREGSG